MPLKTNINKVMKDIQKQYTDIKKAEVRALNRAGRDSHPEAKRQIRAKFNVKAKLINKAKRAPRKATAARESYLLTYNSRRLNVRDYGVRQNRAGIVWKVKKAAPFRIDHGFKIGHNSPRAARILDRFGMIRTGRFHNLDRGGASVRREILKSVTGPSVSQLLNSKGIEKSLEVFFKKKYDTVLERMLRR